jgi:hypothetical protein
MEAVRTSETSVDNHFTRQYNPEDSSEHHTRRRENLKSQIFELPDKLSLLKGRHASGNKAQDLLSTPPNFGCKITAYCNSVTKITGLVIMVQYLDCQSLWT